MTLRDGSPRAGWRLVASGLLASVLVTGVYVRPPTLLAYLDQRVYDVLFRSAHHSDASGRVVIVSVDDRSLERLGRWPWPRRRLAQLLTRIRDLGATSVGLDMVFPEPDETAPTPAGRPRTGARHAAPADRFALTANDAVLAAVLAHGPFILGYGLSFDAKQEQRAECVLHPLRVVSVHKHAGSGEAPLFRASPGICSIPGLARAAPDSGFLNAAPDRDGILRRMPLVTADGGNIYPSLGLATVIMALGTRRIVLRTTDAGVESLALDDAVVPLDTRGGMLLHFSGGKGTFPHISAADLLEDRVSATALRDRIVFVGATAVGLSDTVATPLDTTYPGVELHATVADAILRRDFIWRPRTAPALELGMVLAAGPLAALAVAVGGVTWGATMLGGVGIGLWLGAGRLLGAGIFVSPLFPIAGLTVSFTAITIASLLFERRRADRTTRDLGRTREMLLHSLTSLAGTRDHETGAHLLRTRYYMRPLCENLASHRRFRDFLRPDTIDIIAQLAPIHDIGKVGVSDLILRKPGPLTVEEWDDVRRHPDLGQHVIADAERRAGIRDDFLLRLAKDVVYAHHERWDGTGYPRRLKGEEIPVAGRLMAVVDVYDALVSKRVYKERIPHDEAVRMIIDERGTHFDPDVVDAVVRIQGEWRQILLTLGDGGTDSMHP